MSYNIYNIIVYIIDVTFNTDKNVLIQNTVKKRTYLQK